MEGGTGAMMTGDAIFVEGSAAGVGDPDAVICEAQKITNWENERGGSCDLALFWAWAR
jgi:hypothetical protein